METSVASEGAIEREIRIAASPESVFDHWVDPVRLATWMGRDIVLEARPGGAYRIDYNGLDIASGSYVEVDRPHRLVMTWGWEAPGDPTPPGASLVEVTFEPDGGGTVLRLRHSRLVPEAVAGHAEGWDYFLGRLTEALADA
jgi:uncharacterized protein YndB with AHSA1/START domain